MAEDIVNNLKSEISRRREEQLKQRPVGKQLDAAKAPLVSGTSEMCLADSEPTTLHTNPERRGRRCENSARSGSSDRRNDGCDLAIDRKRTRARSPRTKKQDCSRHNKQLWRCGRDAKQRKSLTSLRTTARRHGEHTVETNTTRGVNQTKEHEPHVRRDDEGNESGESTQSVHAPRRHASMAERLNKRGKRSDEDGHEEPRRMKHNESWKCVDAKKKGDGTKRRRQRE